MAADGKSAGQVVLPFFDGVERSHAPHQTGSFQEAFRSQEMCFEQRDVEAGQQVLGDVSFLKGWEWERIVNGHRGEFVIIVVETDPSEFRQGFRINVPESLVGNNDHIKKIMGLLDTTSNGTRTIGIYGMGGIGKITFTFGEFALQKIVNDSSR